MPFTIDVLNDGTPLAWSLTGSASTPGWSATRYDSYQPSLYGVTASGMEASAPDLETCVDELADLRADLEMHPAVVSCGVESWRPGFRFAEQPVLRVDVDRLQAVREVGGFIEGRGPPGQFPYRAFDVDFSPEFRVCLDRDESPVPERPPRVLHMELSREAAAAEDLTELRIAPRAVPETVADATGPPALESAGETTRDVLETVRTRLAEEDPDVVVVERTDVVPLLADAARERDFDLGLARQPAGLSRELPAYQQLAGASTFESYGRVRHSPSRYNIPGRVLIDRSNTFFYHETNLAGCLDLVKRSRKPLQELSWASIGNVLTAMQIREARERGVLVQWRAWRPERFKTAATLHDADRGGTTLSPEVGFHEDVHELDFSSLYPNIICEFNLSPETVRCRCHDGDDVPELGYPVCDEAGYLPDVLQPVIDDRAEMKAKLREGGLSAAEREALQGQSNALKWILVSCFGYQGFSNAKFGRIEVHEAINAYARDILLTAKETLEAGGWRVIHGIVDSVWVTPRADADDRTPLPELAAAISDEVGITLEYEGAFDWVAFCPLRDGQAGALTKYFGRRREPDGSDAYKMRGIECRQRSTCEWVADLQRECIELLEAHREPEPVCDHLQLALRELREGAVDATELVLRTRASKDLDEYSRRSRTVAALERAEQSGMETHPGQDVRYVVVDDAKQSRERVRIAAEVTPSTAYDVAFYREQAIRSVGSVLSPLGWDSDRIEQYLSESEPVSLEVF